MIEVRCIDVCSWLWNFLWTCKKLFWYEFHSFSILDQKFVSMRGWKTEIQSATCGFLEAYCDFSGCGDAHLQGAVWNTPGTLQPVPHPACCGPARGTGLCWEGRRCEQPLSHCRAAARPPSIGCPTAVLQLGLPAVTSWHGSCVRNRGRREVSWREVLCHHSVSTLTLSLARIDFYLHLINGSSFKKTASNWELFV